MLSWYVGLLQNVIEWLFQLFLLVLYHKLYYVYDQLVENTVLIKVWSCTWNNGFLLMITFAIIYTVSVCTSKTRENVNLWCGTCGPSDTLYWRHLLVIIVLQKYHYHYSIVLQCVQYEHVHILQMGQRICWQIYRCWGAHLISEGHQ